MPDDAGWPLDRGERLLWQGRPGPGRHLTPPVIAIGVAGAISVVTGSVFLALASGEIALLAAGLAEILAGAVLLGVVAAWGPLVRRHRRYALTDRRAMVMTRLPGTGLRLTVLPIAEVAGVEILPGDPGSLRLVPRNADPGPVLFAGIPDAPAVEALVRRLQRGTA